jgi:SecD/SecF fusion protein
MINLSINQTLSRTLLTSGTVLIASIILYIVGGQGIHAFAFAMVIGVIAGTYSTIYIAAPALLWMRKSAAAISHKTAEPAATAR